MGNQPLFPRFATDRVRAALKDTPVVMVNGPRQSGKTTLVRDLVAGERAYVTLDDDTVLEAIRADPVGFVRSLDVSTIDEVQRAPDLLRAIKRSVDDDRRPGRFLLTGSANVLTLPRVSESLAGRMEIVTLLPLSRAEIRRRPAGFLHKAFAGSLVSPPEDMMGGKLVELVFTGGYPEMQRRHDPSRRRAWARDYLTTVVRRDVRDVTDVEKLDHMTRLVRVLAHHAGQLTNFAQIGGQIGLDDKTSKKYTAILEELFLVRRLEPWSHNRLKRLVKTPKLHFLDSGLLATISGFTPETIGRDRTSFGPLLETFVFGEVLKQADGMDLSSALFHYRDKDQDEVDIVIESEAAGIVGIEIKAAATVNAADFKGLRKLADAARGTFKVGIVLYDGETIVPFGDRMFAAPIPCLWG